MTRRLHRRDCLAALGSCGSASWMGGLGWGAGLVLSEPARASDEFTTAPLRPNAVGRALVWPQHLRLGSGASLNRTELERDAVVLVFMSLTCSYCLRHSTHLEVLHQRAKVKASAQLSPHLRVLGGFVDATPDAARRHMESHAWSFAYTVDASALNGLAQQLDTRRVMPRSYVVAPGGRVVQAVPGEMSLPDVLEWANLVPARAGP